MKTIDLPIGDLETAILQRGSPSTQKEVPFRYKPYEFYAKEDIPLEEMTIIKRRPHGGFMTNKGADDGFVIDKGVEDMEYTLHASTTVTAKQSERQLRDEIPVLPSVFSPHKSETSI